MNLKKYQTMKSENIYDYIVRSTQEWQPLIEGTSPIISLAEFAAPFF